MEQNGVALIKFLELDRDMGIEEMSFIGDSLIFIRETRTISRNWKSLSSKMHHLLLCLAKEFKQLPSFMFWEGKFQNHQADSMANKGVGLSCGALEKDNIILENI